MAKQGKQMDRSYLILSKILHDLRVEDPRSRAVDVIKLYKNTSAVKQLCCAVCGEIGPSFSAKWPETKRSIEWAHAHRAAKIEAAATKLATDAERNRTGIFRTLVSQ